MKLVISTSTLTTLTNESISIYANVAKVVGKSTPADNVSKEEIIEHTLEACKGLKHYNASEANNELTIEINDELLFAAVRCYAKLAKLVLPVVVAVKAMVDGLMPIVKSEVTAFEALNNERVVDSAVGQE